MKYFVSYNWAKDENSNTQGCGNCILNTVEPIKNIEDFREMKAKIEEEFKVGYVIVMNFKELED